MAESTVLKESMVAASRSGARVFRNNVGSAWQGESIKLKNGDILIRNGRWVKYGLCDGSSDLIGWRTVKITAEMVGTQIAQFVAIETKYGRGRATNEQTNFLKQIDEAGGIAILAYDAQDVTNTLTPKNGK